MPRYTPNGTPEGVEKRMSAKLKRERAVKARTQGKTWQQVADEVGYSSPGSASAAVSEYFKNYPSPHVEELRAIENLKLDEREQDLLKVLVAEHIVIQQGRVVTRFIGWMTGDDGKVMLDSDGKMVPKLEEIIDHDPILRVVNMLLAVYTRRAKLNGLDAVIEKDADDDKTVDEEIVELVQAMVEAGPLQVPEGHPEKIKAEK